MFGGFKKAVLVVVVVLSIKMTRALVVLSPPGSCRRWRDVAVFKKTKRKESAMDLEERQAIADWQKKEARRERKKLATAAAAAKSNRKDAAVPPPRKGPETPKKPDEEPDDDDPRRRVVVLPTSLLKRRLLFDRLGPAEFLGGFDDVASLPAAAVPEVAFLGRSNVGKSSLLNALLAERKNVAITGRTPGRTRRVNLFRLRDHRGSTCTFADLPGYGFAKLNQDEQDDIAAFVRAYLDERPQLKCLVFLVDARRDPRDEDGYVLNQLRKHRHQIDILVVATKIDKLANGRQLIDKLNAFNEAFDLPPDQPLFFSAITRQGRTDLWAAINDAISSRKEADDLPKELELETTPEIRATANHERPNIHLWESESPQFFARDEGALDDDDDKDNGGQHPRTNRRISSQKDKMTPPNDDDDEPIIL
mmetsp:Transcript_18704/g.60454  ORF Transcript_18704/g.60454 Transcript_18704/m.60454 type:complete len:421 (-) Transcript_18704:336-1598(-)